VSIDTGARLATPFGGLIGQIVHLTDPVDYLGSLARQD
jgi:hypothetical protein